MILDSDGISRYRAYILYGKNIENLLQRIVSYVEDCKNIVTDIQLDSILSKFCQKKNMSLEVKSYEDIDKAIAVLEEGKAIVFRVKSPRDDVYAIAFIPIDQFNKSRIGGS